MDDFDVLDLMPPELWCEVLKYCGDIHSYRLLKGTKDSNPFGAIVKHHLYYILDYHPPIILKDQLYLDQVYAMKRLSKKRVAHLKAPMGSGKTRMAILYAIEKGWKTVIIVPTSALQTWMDEFIKLGIPLKARPEDSQVLVYHSKKTYHRKLKSSEIRNFRFVITTPKIFSGIHQNMMADRRTMIIDEAHKKVQMDYRARQWMNDRFRDTDTRYAILTLSAYNACSDYFTHPKRVVEIEPDQYDDQEDYPLIINHKKGISDLNYFLDNIFGKKKRNMEKILFISSASTDEMKRMKITYDGNAKYRKTFKFFVYQSSYTAFERSKMPAIMFVNYQKIMQGTNLVKVDTIVSERMYYPSFGAIRQTFGRVRRRNNKNKIIHHYRIANRTAWADLMALIKTTFATAFEYNGLTIKSQASISLISVQLARWGIDYTTLSDMELMIIGAQIAHSSANNAYTENNLPELFECDWENTRTVLPINTLLNLSLY